MLSASGRSLARATCQMAGGGLILSFGTATYYRPLPSRAEIPLHNNNNIPDALDDEEHIHANDSNRCRDDDVVAMAMKNASNCQEVVATSFSTAASIRKNEPFCSEDSPYFDRDETPFLLSMARYISIGATTLAIRLFMNTYGQYQIQDDEHYQHFLKLVLGRNDLPTPEKIKSNSSSSSNSTEATVRAKVPLITISNHRSLFDDPGVVSCLLPLWMGVQPKYNRWGICSQEYCFNDALPAVVKGYIGAGQVLPIQRGGGINQRLFLDFASLVAKGEWCHIFPEAGVWQWKELGGRGRRFLTEVDAKDPKKVGKSSKLKYGVGKLIAHAPVTPRVVPFAHVGMEIMLPMDEFIQKTGENIRKTRLKRKIFGGEPLKVDIQFGAEIHFDDLIQEYEAAHGKLWKYHHNVESRNQHFTSSESEKVLYAKITARIENHLEKLAKRTVASRDVH